MFNTFGIMKSLRLLFVLSLGMFLFSSCEKDFSCECKFVNKPEKDFEVKLAKMRKGDAKTACLDIKLHMDTVSSANCELK